MTLLALVLLAVVLVAIAVWASWTAGRLDRLHHLVETAEASLDAQLVRRSAVALEVASSGLLDPAASVLLAEAAHEARAATDVDRGPAESALSVALRAVLGQPGLREQVARAGDAALALLDELVASAQRAAFARTFHNDAVAAAVRIRHKRPVRWLRLAGTAREPRIFEFDDQPPATAA
ncbi:MAG: hypothetical protein ACRDMV_17305 [Streptosporangiales bacterium]